MLYNAVMSRRTLRSARAALPLEPVLNISIELTGMLPPAQSQAKREYEYDAFMTIRAERTADNVSMDKLREDVVRLLHPLQGTMKQPALVYSACCDNDTAQEILLAALRVAAEEENWREIWIILGHIDAWLTVLPRMHQGAVHPWWLHQARVQGGPSGVNEVVVLDGPRAKKVKTEKPEPAPQTEGRQHGNAPAQSSWLGRGTWTGVELTSVPSPKWCNEMYGTWVIVYVEIGAADVEGDEVRGLELELRPNGTGTVASKDTTDPHILAGELSMGAFCSRGHNPNSFLWSYGWQPTLRNERTHNWFINHAIRFSDGNAEGACKQISDGHLEFTVDGPIHENVFFGSLDTATLRQLSTKCMHARLHEVYAGGDEDVYESLILCRPSDVDAVQNILRADPKYARMRPTQSAAFGASAASDNAAAASDDEPFYAADCHCVSCGVAHPANPRHGQFYEDLEDIDEWGWDVDQNTPERGICGECWAHEGSAGSFVRWDGMIVPWQEYNGPADGRTYRAQYPGDPPAGSR